MENSQIQKLRLARRPANRFFGSSQKLGKDSIVISNMFPTKILQDSSSDSGSSGSTKAESKDIGLMCYQYHITIDPEVDPTNSLLINQIMYIARPRLEQILRKISILGVSMFVVRKIGQEAIKRLEQTFSAEGIQVNEERYSLKFNLVKEFEVTEDEALSKETEIPIKGNKIIHLLNLQIKSEILQYHRENRINLYDLGRRGKLFETDTSQIVVSERGHGPSLEVFQGFNFNIFPAEKKLFFLVDFASRIIQNETALQFLKKNDPNKIIFQSVVTKYNRFQNYMIYDVVKNLNPQHKFKTSTNTEVSYINYYSDKYGIQIRDHKQPLLRSVVKKRNSENEIIEEVVFLIPELCYMTGMSDEQKSNHELMRSLSQHTQLQAHQRLKYSQDTCTKIASLARKMGIKIDPKNSNIFSLTMKPPEITFGNNQKINPGNRGNYDFKNKIFDKTNLKDWLIIYHYRDQGDVDRFIDQIQKAAETYGIQVYKPGFLETQSHNIEEWIQSLDNEFSKNDDLPQFVVSYTKDKRLGDQLYHGLKRFLYSKVGLEHQHVNGMSLQKNWMSVASKILLQIAAKLGKKLWKTEIPEEVLQTNTMVIGIETSVKRIHQQNKSYQAIGVVASISKDLTRYYCDVDIRGDQDISLQKLSLIISAAVKRYVKNEKMLPDQIIVYRQGLGEGQIMNSMMFEINAIREGFKLINEQFTPKFAFFQVNKKINQKFYQEFEGKIKNPECGTLVTNEIVGKGFEFFLCAQNCNIGVCTPTKYQCLYNSTQLSEQTFWQLTYFQCYNYYNWQGPVRVPAPLMYAYKLARFSAEVLNGRADEALTRSLYYL